MSYMPDYEVYINGDLYKIIKFDYQRPSRSIGITPTCHITLDNQIGYLSDVILNGQEVEIHRNNSLRFVGVIDGIEKSSNEAGAELILTVNNKWYKRLQNILCDTYDFQENAGDYGVTINPYDIEVFISSSEDANGISEYIGEPPAIDGFRPDEVIDHIAGTKFIYGHGFETADNILPSTVGLVVDDNHLVLPRNGVSGDDLTYETTGSVESIPLYNGDPNIEPMGDIQSVNVTLWGEDYAGSTVAIEVCRNGGTTGDVSGRDFQTVTLSKSTVEVQSSPLVEITKWEGSIGITEWGATATGNSLAYKVTLTADGAGTPKVEYIKLSCLTDSDAGLTRGTIDAFFGDASLDGADFFEGDLNGLTRLRAADQVQKSALKVYDEGSPVEDDKISAFWDCWIDDAGSINFRKNKGSEINDTFSFTAKRFNAISELMDTSDLWWKVVAFGAGSGVLRTRIVSDEEFSTGGLKIQNVKDTYGDSAKVGKFEDKSAKTVRQLYQRARAQLKLKSNPIRSVKLPNGLFADPVLDIDTGDLLFIEVEDIGLEQYIGIHSMDISVNATDGEQTRVVIGEPVTDLTDVLRDLNQSSAISGSVSQDTVVRDNFQGETFDVDTITWSEYSFPISHPETIKKVEIHAFTDKNSVGDIPFNLEFYVDPDTVPPTSPADDDKKLPGKYGTPNTAVNLGNHDITNLLNKSTNNNITKGIHRIAFKSSGGSASFNGEGLVKILVEITRNI